MNLRPLIASCWLVAKHRCALSSVLGALWLLLAAAPEAVAQPVITNAPGFVITWDGNNGDNPTPPNVPTNIALASQGAVAFASGQLGPEIGAAFHNTTNLNDGRYGNTNSWIGGSTNPTPWFAGIQLPAAVPLTGIAWGRDNNGLSQDRSLGTYTLQISTNATFTTNAADWITLGTISYINSTPGFRPWLRHRYKIARSSGDYVFAQNLRLLVPNSGLVATGTAIDEIELFRSSVTNLAYWRMGENDPGAANGVTNTVTTNVVGGVLSLRSNAVYTSSVASIAAAQAGSSLALQFTTGRYATNTSVFPITDNFGLELWVKPDATNAIQCLAYNGDSGPNGWGLYLYQGKYQGLFGGLAFLTGPDAVPGVWTHLALVRNNGLTTLYVNGVPSTTSLLTPGVPTGRFALAAQPQTLTTEFFAGALDEVRLFTFAPGAFNPADLLLPVEAPAVRTLAATGIGQTNGTLNGTVNPRNLAAAAWFEWGTTTNYGNFTATSLLVAANAPQALSNNLSGLVAGTTYHYRLAASNALGVSYGANVNLITPAFTIIPIAGLPGVSDSAAAWADYDNDGRLDFLLTGWGNAGVSQLWRNHGDGTFSNVTATAAPGLAGVSSCSVAWADYDNDGRLDFLLTGYGDDVTGVSQLWRNHGDGTFSNVTATVAPGLPGVGGSSVAWADYDHDGRLDFLLTGRDNGAVSQLWRNHGDGTFSNVTATAAPGLPGVGGSSVAWADYDNDGRLDFLLTGSPDGGFTGVSQLWRNHGDGTFSNVTATAAPGLPGVSVSSVAWADYDNDGHLDFLLTGFGSGTRVSQLWRNHGDGTFSNVTATAAPGLPSVDVSSVAWADYDNDGRLDFLFTGRPSIGTGVSQLWRNHGDGTFSNVIATSAPGLPGVYGSSVAWADYDNDGRLDILLTGYGGGYVSQLWRNNTPVTNTPPGAPTGLAMTATTNAVMLSWNSASDGQTPASGLTYNVRAGTTPGGTNLLAAHVNATNGFRRVPAMGNAMLRHSLPLTGLTNGQTVYWSVQAVDTSFAGGPFATETSVVTDPVLNILPNTATNALLVWTPPTFGWVLQTTPDLTPATWTNAPSGETNPVLVPLTNATKTYFRITR